MRRTGIADGNRTVETRFAYSAFGLLEREALTTVDDDTDRVSTSTRTFEYENVPCAAPVPARP